MKTIKIINEDNNFQFIETIKTNRNKRFKNNCFLVEGVNNINSAIKNNWSIKYLIYCSQKNNSDWAKNIINNAKCEMIFDFSIPLINKISNKDDISEILAVIYMRDDLFENIILDPNKNPLLALFDRPSNKGNLGTMIRSCDAFNIDVLLITGHGVDLYDPDTIVSSMGSFFNLKTIRGFDMQQVENFFSRLYNTYPNFKLVGTSSHADKMIYEFDFKNPTMFMIGNETKGLSNYYKNKCDELIKIPMSEKGVATSFNVACAATTFFYEAIRQRNYM